jgi:hypothetical protein
VVVVVMVVMLVWVVPPLLPAGTRAIFAHGPSTQNINYVQQNMEYIILLH